MGCLSLAFLWKRNRRECCREQQAMHIHGGGLATSGQSSQNGWTKTSEVYTMHVWFLLINTNLGVSQFLFFDGGIFLSSHINTLFQCTTLHFYVGLVWLLFGSAFALRVYLIFSTWPFNRVRERLTTCVYYTFLSHKYGVHLYVRGTCYTLHALNNFTWTFMELRSFVLHWYPFI